MRAENFPIYTYNLETTSVDVFIKDETIWLTQKGMSELFGRDKSVISRHLKDIFESGELDEKVVVAKNATTTQHGAIPEKSQTSTTNFYNLDAIISVGYRVNSQKATHFRIWATQILREYIIKGFVMDDERLKLGKKTFEKDYFKELLERIRSIRASESRIWLQITDIFAECSIDYDKNSKITKDFFANVQNKFHFAITGQTAAEIIHQNANHHSQNMGLKTWKNSPDGRILASDTTIAKNYLDEKQIRRLERTVSGFFDYIEDLVEDETILTMEDFSKSLNAFLEFRNYKVLTDKGKISSQQAREKALREYQIFNQTQKINSDFRKQIKSIRQKEARND